eukprot:Amastigsp_a523873_20.p2 type:complete len:163 gc:universal Amastigsp_a523873_20:289-777(+)
MRGVRDTTTRARAAARPCGLRPRVRCCQCLDSPVPQHPQAVTSSGAAASPALASPLTCWRRWSDPGSDPGAGQRCPVAARDAARVAALSPVRHEGIAKTPTAGARSLEGTALQRFGKSLPGTADSGAAWGQTFPSTFFAAPPPTRAAALLPLARPAHRPLFE